MNLVITGATGYIGSHLSCLAIKRGHHVIAASRKRPNTNVSDWLPFELFSMDSFVLPLDTNVVIHLAAEIASTSPLVNEAEVLAVESLLQATHKIAARFIYISSQTARQDAPTLYGKKKWLIEQKVLEAGGWVVRPGQVYGGRERGLFGILVGVVRRLPMLPRFLPGPKLQLIHVDDLTEGLLSSAECDSLKPGILCLASSKTISFTKFLSVIAHHRIRRKRVFIPIPVSLVKLLGVLIGSHLRARLGIERLDSLFNLPAMDTAGDLKRLGLALRPTASGMHPSGNNNRRRLLQEGNAFLTYILRDAPALNLLRCYVRAVEKVRGGRPIEVLQSFYNLPLLLALLEKRAYLLGQQGDEFDWRLDAAMVLAEATPQGARRFLSIGKKSGMFISLILMLWGLISEVFWRVASFISIPVLRIWFTQGKF